MYRKCLRDGVVQPKIGTKGVLLARRDNSKFVRDVYERVISMIADEKPKEHVLSYVADQVILTCAGGRPVDDFVITKSVGNYGDVTPETQLDDKGQLTGKALIGEYTAPLLPFDKESPEYVEALTKKNVSSAREYYLSCLPPPVQLADRMKRRGVWVDTGTRLEYVVTDPENHTSKQSEKIEDVEYMKHHNSVIKIDYFYYIKALANPLDQVLSVAFKDVTDFVLKLYIYIYKHRNKVMSQIKEHSSAMVVFREATTAPV